MKRLVPVFALLVAFSAVMIYVVRSRTEAKPAEGAAPVNPAVAVQAPPAIPAPEPEEPSKKPAKKRGIVVSSFEEGSRVDPDAPISALTRYETLRDAELKRWSDARMDLTFTDKTLREILTGMLRDYGLKASIDPGSEVDKTISFSVKDLAGNHCLRLLVQQYDLKWVVDEHGESWIVPEDKRDMYEPEAWRSMVEMQEVAKTIAAEDAVGIVPEADQAVNRAMDSIKISLNFTESPLSTVMEFICEVTQLNVVIERRQIKDADTLGISLQVENAPLRDALKSAFDDAGLGFRVYHGVLVVTTKEEIERLARLETDLVEARTLAVKEEAGILDKWVTLSGQNLAIREVADLISKATGIGYVIDTPTWNRAARLSFDGEPHTLREIFAAMASGAPVRVAYRDGKMWFLDKPVPKSSPVPPPK